MNIEEIKSSIETNIQSMLSSLPVSLAKREDEFFNKLKTSKLSDLKKLEKLYSFMDVLYDHVHKYTPCKKGCAHCCSYDVTISDIEIQYIEKNNKKTKRIKNIKANNKGTGRPCIFLKKQNCTIYNSRPYVCRRHVILALDNTVCQNEYAHNNELKLLAWSELDKSYDFIRATSGSNTLHDIRDVFENKAIKY